MAATPAGRVAHQVVLGLWCASSAGCGLDVADAISKDERWDSARHTIVGGSAAPDDDSVFALKVLGSNGRTVRCSAVLISGRTLLTAAHCIDPAMLEAETVTVLAHHRARDGLALADDWLPITQTRVHPSFNPFQLQNTADLALLLLPTLPLGTAPKPWNSVSVDALSGQMLRALGYGGNGLLGGDGVRRSAEVVLRQFRPGLLIIGDQGLSPETGHGICPGDSGGPSLYTFADGQERVVGIHSYTVSPACTDGADTRVDTYADFIAEWVWTVETSVCAADGVCGADCLDTRFDADCEAATSCHDGACLAPQPEAEPAHEVPAADEPMPTPRGCQTVPSLGMAVLALSIAFRARKRAIRLHA